MPKLIVACLLTAAAWAQTSPLTLEQKEEFLKTAQVVRTKDSGKGITNTVRATLSLNGLTHDASIQRIDEELARFETPRGIEYNFRDTYKFNIAAYRLGRMLGLGGMIPPSVECTYGGSPGAFTWWVENVAMDEAGRTKDKVLAPDEQRFNRQYVIMKVFDQLIYNTDRNKENVLYDKDWRLWMIDHTRAFRNRPDLPDAKALKMCDRELLGAMKALTFERLKAELMPYLRETEIRAVLMRRDKIVALFEKKGQSALYDHLIFQ